MAYLEETLKTLFDSTNDKVDAFSLLVYVDKMVLRLNAKTWLLKQRLLFKEQLMQLQLFFVVLSALFSFCSENV
jgi:hypothetical protein